MSALNCNLLADGFSVCNSGNFEVNFNAELCLELCNNSVKMLFAET
jgi:hypothetical protein